jgi:LPS O-antigen subunit length determinant protein (WzzB/FepE family)
MLSGTKTYPVSKSELLKKLRDNKDIHVEEYEATVQKYREKAKQELTERLAKVERGEKFNLVFNLPKPISYEQEYLHAIGLLEMTTDEVIQITASDYKQFVLDQWDWKRRFSETSNSYGVGSAYNSDEEE